MMFLCWNALHVITFRWLLRFAYKVHIIPLLFVCVRHQLSFIMFPKGARQAFVAETTQWGGNSRLGQTNGRVKDLNAWNSVVAVFTESREC